MGEIKRVLMLADFGCNSGFAQVAHNIVTQVLQDKDIDWQFDIIGINYYGEPSVWSGLYPRVRIFPATVVSRGDLFGRQGFLDRLMLGIYDIAFVLQDTFIVEPLAPKIKEARTQLAMAKQKTFRWIYYFPIDAAVKENWVKGSVSLADYPISYTQYGYDECVRVDPGLLNKLKIIPHGIEEKTFYPMKSEEIEKFRHEYFVGKADNKWLITNVNRNQPRKDMARTLQAYSILKKQIPDAMLYLHCKTNDVAYDIREVARNFDLTNDDYIAPQSFNEHDGLPVEYMNGIYNSSQVLTTTTLGEGWGLSLTEAMACKCPVIAPNHTSCSEILADGRGILVQAGRTNSEMVVLPNDNERLRPITNVSSLVDKLVWLRQNYKSQEVKTMVDKAYNHVIDNWTWDKVGEKWRETFAKSLPKIIETKIGRNDSCPCGSGKKYKNCCLK